MEVAGRYLTKYGGSYPIFIALRLCNFLFSSLFSLILWHFFSPSLDFKVAPCLSLSLCLSVSQSQRLSHSSIHGQNTYTTSRGVEIS